MELPTPEDLQTLTDPDLEELRLRVSQETIRRDELNNLPAQVEALTQRFVDHGGDKGRIRDPKTYEKTPRPPHGNNA